MSSLKTLSTFIKISSPFTAKSSLNFSLKLYIRINIQIKMFNYLFPFTLKKISKNSFCSEMFSTFIKMRSRLKLSSFLSFLFKITYTLYVINSLHR